MVDKSSDRLVGFDGGLSRRDLLVGAGSVLLAGGLAACGGSGGSSSGGGGSTAPAGTPKRGGNFRLGVTGGGASDIIDGQSIITKPDQARLAASWETLVTYDDNYKLTNGGLAESVIQTKPTEWTIKLHSGIEFNNGKTLTADDVIYSLNRILDPKQGLFGAAGLGSIDAKNMKKADNLTVIVPLTSPDSTIGEQLGQYLVTLLVRVGQDQRLDQRASGAEKHVLGPTQADALGSEATGAGRILRGVRIGADGHPTRVVGNAHDPVHCPDELVRVRRVGVDVAVEVADHGRGHDGHLPEEDLTGRAVDGDDGALLEDPAVPGREVA